MSRSRLASSGTWLMTAPPRTRVGQAVVSQTSVCAAGMARRRPSPKPSSFSMAESPSHGVEACARRPRAVRRTRRAPFECSARVSSDGSTTTNRSAASPSAANCAAPCSPPVSSSVTATSHHGMPRPIVSRKTTAAAAIPPFMSRVPRPYSRSPSRRASNWLSSPGTTSRWPHRMTFGRSTPAGRTTPHGTLSNSRRSMATPGTSR